MSSLYRRLRRAAANEAGQGLPEYALILGLVAVFCMATLSLLGGQIGSVLDIISDTITP